MATYFVSTTGNNANAGTELAPWRYLSYAYTRVVPGDTVYVRGGSYTSESHSVDFVNKTGTATAKYTFRAYPGEIPILDGPGTDTWAIAI